MRPCRCTVYHAFLTPQQSISPTDLLRLLFRPGDPLRPVLHLLRAVLDKKRPGHDQTADITDIPQRPQSGRIVARAQMTFQEAVRRPKRKLLTLRAIQIPEKRFHRIVHNCSSLSIPSRNDAGVIPVSHFLHHHFQRNRTNINAALTCSYWLIM